MKREEALNKIGELVVYARAQGWDEGFTEAFEILSVEPCEDWYELPSDEMTLGQARQAVKDLREKLAEHFGDTVSLEAFKQVMWERDIAIGQLKELGYGFGQKIEPCDDTISRQSVLDYIYNDLGLGDEENGNDVERQMELEGSYKYVKSLPPVTPQQKIGRWIPVSERLPENDEDVLVCFPQGGMAVAYYHIDDTHYPTQYANLNETGWFNEEDDAFYFEPIAWMPLPEPYKAEREEYHNV